MPLHLEVDPDPTPDLTAFKHRVSEVGRSVARQHSLCSVWEGVLTDLGVPVNPIRPMVSAEVEIVYKAKFPVFLNVDEYAGLSPDEQLVKATEYVSGMAQFQHGHVTVLALEERDVESVAGVVLVPGLFSCFKSGSGNYLRHITTQPEKIGQSLVTGRLPTLLCRPNGINREIQVHTDSARPDAGMWCGTCLSRAQAEWSIQVSPEVQRGH
jgi:hypothetical protein